LADFYEETKSAIPAVQAKSEKSHAGLKRLNQINAVEFSQASQEILLQLLE
jgi:hypothetical protein